jgi:hypothetical protein
MSFESDSRQMSEKSENPYQAGCSTISGPISAIHQPLLMKSYEAYQAIYGHVDLIRPILVFGFFRPRAPEGVVKADVTVMYMQERLCPTDSPF